MDVTEGRKYWVFKKKVRKELELQLYENIIFVKKHNVNNVVLFFIVDYPVGFNELY